MNLFGKTFTLPLKKVAFVALMFGVVVAVCSTNHNPPVSVSKPVCDGDSCHPGRTAVVEQDAGPATVTVALDHWKFTLPDSGWEAKTIDDASALINTTRNNMIVYSRTPFAGNALQFALLAVYASRQVGAQIVSAKNVKASGRDWLVLEILSGDSTARLWYWVGFSNGYGYKFKCGGDSNDNSQRLLCAEIGSTLLIEP
jgi:hypothetical protein